MKKLFLIAIGAFILSSCSSEEPTTLSDYLNSDNLYSYKSIIERANLYYSQLPGKTRSSIPKVQAATQIGNTCTRTEEVDNIPVYYLVNYENEKGFVIVGANDAADSMVAISDEGNLNMTDTIENKSLAAFMNVILNPNESSDNIVMPDPMAENVTIEPKLDSRVRKWGQSSPFNAYIPVLSNGLRGYTGCAPLSSAMIMSYYKHPDSHEGRTYDWNSIIRNYSDDSLAFLLYDLGTSGNLNVEYKLTGTGAYPGYFSRTFKNFDYSFPSEPITLTSFDFSSKFNVTKQLPMLVYGWMIQDNTEYGHAWVIDGLLHLQTPLDMATGEYSEEFYFHCVWGWYGKGNGYFKSTKINSIGGERFASDGTDGMFPGYQDSDNVPTWDIDVSGLWGIIPAPQMVFPGLQ